MQANPITLTRYTGIYPGRLDQVRHVRWAVASYLANCPAASDAILVVSELAANAIVHSASQGQVFIVRAERFPDYVWVETEDLGGPWRRRRPDGCPHGLDLVDALTGPDGWGVELTTNGRRVVWARIDLL